LTAPFTGITVLELAGGIPGPYCSRLLADLGAKVIKIEPPGYGDPVRRLGPFPGGIPDREAGGLFLFLNTGKQSITLDPAVPFGRDLFLKLASASDVLIEDRQPGVMAGLNLDYDTVKDTNPALVYVSITPYGQDGPKAHWKATHLNSFHSSGEGYTLPGGETYLSFPDRGPVTAGANLGDFDTAILASSATVAALYAREFLGAGQRIDISRQEATLGMNRLEQAQFLSQGREFNRSRSYEYGGIFPCRDGYVMLYPREDHQWRALAGIMGQPELGEDDRFSARADRIRNGDALNSYVRPWAASLGKREIYDLVAPSGCPAAYYANAQDLMESPQLNARDFFQTIDHPRTGPLTYPTVPYRVSGIPWTAPEPAPFLGQHNQEVLCGDLGLTPEDLPDLRRAGVI
jgi:formyl-CoA transferase